MPDKKALKTFFIVGILATLIFCCTYTVLHVDFTYAPVSTRRLAWFYNGGSLKRGTLHSVSGIMWNETELDEELQLRLQNATDKKIIVFWSIAFGSRNKMPSPNLQECGNCDITYNRSLINDSRTGAVVYHFDSVNASDMPTSRNPNHLHIFWTMESSATLKNYHYTLETEDKFQMNATMTYRLDSDFLTGYGGGESLGKLVGKNSSIYHEIMKPKSKLAVAAISDCTVTPGARVRLSLIKQLQSKGLTIDAYGKCFSNFIDTNLLHEVIPQYKFYFAYENSYHCRDYITEKFFVKTLWFGTVPVVWGATKEDYQAIAPPGSFILAEEFESANHLIDYLQFLDQNDEEYLKYFRWRTMDAQDLPQYKRKSGFCAICRAIHGINVDARFKPNYNSSCDVPMFSDGVAKRTASLRRYLYNDDNAECFSPFKTYNNRK